MLCMLISSRFYRKPGASIRYICFPCARCPFCAWGRLVIRSCCLSSGSVAFWFILLISQMPNEGGKKPSRATDFCCLFLSFCLSLEPSNTQKTGSVVFPDTVSYCCHGNFIHKIVTVVMAQSEFLYNFGLDL